MSTAIKQESEQVQVACGLGEGEGRGAFLRVRRIDVGAVVEESQHLLALPRSCRAEERGQPVAAHGVDRCITREQQVEIRARVPACKEERRVACLGPRIDVGASLDQELDLLFVVQCEHERRQAPGPRASMVFGSSVR